MRDSRPRALPSDYARRIISVAVGIVTAILYYIGVKAFAHTMTFSFSSAGFAIVPLGMFIWGIILIPLMSQSHKFWVKGDPHKRAADRERDEKEEKRMRLSTGDSPSAVRRRAAEANRAEHEGRARADALEQQHGAGKTADG